MCKSKRKVNSVKEPLSNVMTSVLSESLSNMGINLSSEEVDTIIDVAEEIQLNGGSVLKSNPTPYIGPDEIPTYGRTSMKEEWDVVLQDIIKSHGDWYDRRE